MQLHRPTTRNQSGFSVIEVLLIVLVVAVLALIGVLIYQRHKPSSANNSAATGTTQTTKQPATTITQYLTIKEWGVKLPLSDTVKTAYYKTAKGSSYGPGGLPSTVWLGIASLSSSSCNPGNNDAGGRGAIGAILRVLPTDTDPVSGKLLTQEYPNGTTIGGYYYTYQSWMKNNPCASQSTLQPIDAAFAAAAKGIISTTTTQYLTIKEWGVRVPYSGSLKLSYTMSSVSRTATFSSDQLTALSTDCTGRGGFITRWASNEQVSEGPPDANTPTAEQAFAGKDPSAVPYAHIGNYYYTFAHDQAACGDLNTTAALQSQTNDAVKALVANLQATPN